jgi:hypothetical protein
MFFPEQANGMAMCGPQGGKLGFPMLRNQNSDHPALMPSVDEGRHPWPTEKSNKGPSQLKLHLKLSSTT